MNVFVAALRFGAPVLVVLGTAATLARSAPTEPTVEEVRAAYVEVGLVASTPTVDADGVASFSVDGTAGAWTQPTLRVFVYPNTDHAQGAHRAAQAREEGNRNLTLQYTDDRGPQLLSGYGLSVWRHNVAVIQVAPTDDVGAYPVEIDCAVDPNAPANPLPRTTVAPAYVAPLESMLARRGQANQ
jgi:hypothetical protein